jgi:hypothetical protein
MPVFCKWFSLCGQAIKNFKLIIVQFIDPLLFIISTIQDILTVLTLKMVIFWVVVPCSLVEVYQRFRGALMMEAASTSEMSVQQSRRQLSSYSSL